LGEQPYTFGTGSEKAKEAKRGGGGKKPKAPPANQHPYRRNKNRQKRGGGGGYGKRGLATRNACGGRLGRTDRGKGGQIQGGGGGGVTGEKTVGGTIKRVGKVTQPNNKDEVRVAGGGPLNKWGKEGKRRKKSGNAGGGNLIGELFAGRGGKRRRRGGREKGKERRKSSAKGTVQGMVIHSKEAEFSKKDYGLHEKSCP